MIKRVHSSTTPPVAANVGWLDLDEQLQVELTSEDPDWPIEGALLPDSTRGWRAATAGPQTIALIWPDSIELTRVRLVFDEHSEPRTQEFVLRAFTGEGTREVVRQQFTFSPPGTTLEREDYEVKLAGVTRLELTIVPSIGKAGVVATLTEWRVG